MLEPDFPLWPSAPRHGMRAVRAAETSRSVAQGLDRGIGTREGLKRGSYGKAL